MKREEYFAVFLVDYLYYIPQFLPIAKEMAKRKYDFIFILPRKHKRDIIATQDLAIETCKEYHIKYQIGEQEGVHVSSKYLISGSNTYPVTAIQYQKSVLVVHGVGTKVGYFTEEQNKYDIRFVEGEFRFNKIKELYPDYGGVLKNVGFSKLDDVLNMTSDTKNNLFKQFTLDPNKKTILYAPTFYPSSIEKMSVNFPKDFADYNIIVKPHYFTYLRKKYRAQRKKINQWSSFPNTYVAGVNDYNLAPFFAVSDIMVSDESSAIFEFAALNKPVICNRFITLRLTYRLFKAKFKKKMDSEMDQFRDIGVNAMSYSDLKKAISSELANPDHFKTVRETYTKQVIGPVDGQVSVRMLDVLETH
ncbi:MAG: CDP-glycerol glycerophosphotransferase [Ancylomarina sp.]|jgi:CDP-glycerol glycerophosphotransferase